MTGFQKSFTLCLIIVPTFLIFVSGKKPRGLISEKDNSVWRGTYAGQTYTLSIDGSKEIWFTGMISTSGGTTYYLHGFEKGSTYPTSVNTAKDDLGDRSSIGHIFMWNRGMNVDSIEVKNDRDSIVALPIYLTLYKQNK